jgi:hypothetical protein
MNGALMKATSRFAIAAGFGLLLGVSSAQAADLGGNCCADLEERIAELEATTARKGNRKMSLTVTGQVHRMVLWWDDGQNSDAYYGLDNTNSSSRFSFIGEATVRPGFKVGFDITIEIEAGGTSSKVSQFDEDGKVGAQLNGLGQGSFNTQNTDAYFGDARRAAFYLDDARLGRLTVGRYETAGAITTIDLGGISAPASASVVLVNGSFLLRGGNGQFFAMNWGNLGDPSSNQGRTELVRYDSPTLAGFIFSASIGEAGDYWGTMLRYAGEHHGWRVAAGIGYENATDRQTSAACAQVGAACINNSNAGPADLTAVKPEVEAWGAGLSLLHVATGFFAQGHYLAADFSSTGNSGYWGQVANKADAEQWLIQVGITRNWTGLGNTAFYGEYSKNEDWGAGKGAGRTYANTALGAAATAVNNVTATDMRVWGLGVVQNLDAAATELYLSYRNFSADVTAGGAKLDTEDFHAIISGARVKF